MDRLTHRETPENKAYVDRGLVELHWYSMENEGYRGEAIDRLAAYEDKGVAPEDTLTSKEMAEVACALNELKAYKDTERTPEEVKSMSHLFDYVVAESKTMPETVKFFQRLRELAQAEKDGRVFVLPKTRARWIKDIIDERERQDQKWGFPQKNTYCEWSSILAEETGELAKELNELNFGRGDRSRMIIEAVQVAAVTLAILEQSGVAHKVTEQISKSLGREFIPPLCFYGSNGSMCPGMSVDGDDEPVGRCKDCFWCSAGYTQYDTEAVLNEGGSK